MVSKENKNEPCVYRHKNNRNFMFIVLYVDDILPVENGIGIISLVTI